MARSIYICYFGIRQPLVQTQVIPYLLELRKDGVEIVLLTFEPDLRKVWTSEQISDKKREMAEKGIEWHCLAYHKRLSVLATTYDIFTGAVFIRRMINKGDVDILHGRVHVPTLMGAIARKLSKNKPKLLFDIRGFFPEEYTDAGVWPENGIIYRTVKRIEKWLMKEADGFVVLTEKARQILFPESAVSGEDKLGRPVEVIPCCVDIANFSLVEESSRDEIRKEIGAVGRRVMVYVGSFGGWYLTSDMIDLFAAARERDPGIFVLILTQADKAELSSRLLAKGFTANDFFVDRTEPRNIARYLISADVAVSFIKACYSKQSSSPTKIAEYLACGLPIIANCGVGDVDAMIENNRVGVLVREFTKNAYVAAFDEIDELGSVQGRATETAMREFDLEKVGGERYRSLYRNLLG